MIRDLLRSPTPHQEARADVLVIGAGIAGLLLATRLARSGRRVVVVESGDLRQIDETHPLNEVEQLGDVYSGAEHGRFRCLGGTSTRWGGAMLPFQEGDMASDVGSGDDSWSTALGALTPYQDQVQRLFGLGDGPYDFPQILPGRAGHPRFLPRLAKWPPFRLRNVASLLADDVRSDKGPEIWLNATATDFVFAPGGRLSSVNVQSCNGRKLTVAATETVLAAGAIESTRLLLLADRQHDDRIFAPDDILGRYFYDHLSAPTAILSKIKRKQLNRLIGFRFEDGMMRNLRFEPNKNLRAERGIPAGFVHIAFATDAPTGFDALRDIYRRIQRRERPGVREVVAMAGTLPWLARAAWWRFFEKRLLFPDGAALQVHVVIEQEPCASNRIGLSAHGIDPHGCPRATIDWRVSASDAANLVATTEAFLEAWNTSHLANLATLGLNLPQDPRGALVQGGGIFHPGGSVRMGNLPSRGVVDGELRTFRVPNIRVVSTATFPRGGGANPTMTLMMAAMRTADRIAQLSR